MSGVPRFQPIVASYSEWTHSARGRRCDESETSLARGEGRIITQESMRGLAEQVKQRGRARLAAEQNATR